MHFTIFQPAKVVDKSGCKVLKRQNKKDRRGSGVRMKPNSMVQTPCFLKRKKIKIKMRQKRKKKIEKEKNKSFVSCVIVCDTVRFVLRRFLGFLACFYLFTLIVIHFDKIRGLERLKMRFLNI